MTDHHTDDSAAPGTGPVVEITLPLHQGTVSALIQRINPGGTSLTPAEIAHALEEAMADRLRAERLAEIVADGRAEHGEPGPERAREIRGYFAEADEMWQAEQAGRAEGAEGAEGAEEWRAPLAG